MTPALYERSLLEDLAPLEGPNATRDLSTADPTEPDSYRLAFADPEFMARRETRGIRFHLELLKPDLDQQAMGIEHTVVWQCPLRRFRGGHPSVAASPGQWRCPSPGPG